MEFDPKDIDVVALLTKLRSAENHYPSDLFASRRLDYKSKVAEIGLGLGIGAGIRNTPKPSPGGSSLTKVGGVFEMILVAAIVAEAGAAIYFYRSDISDVVQSYRPGAQESESVPEPGYPSLLPEVVHTEVPEATETPRVTLTNTPTVTATVVPTVVTVVDETFEANDQAVSTPDLKGNNGNQYGKTPKPERTKENNSGGKDKDK